MVDQYWQEIIDPGDRASQLGKEICFASHGNCDAVRMYPHQPGNFRGAVGFTWKPHILKRMANNSAETWTMLEEVENDGAGGKPQFFTLVGTPEVFTSLGWEIIEMVVEDFSRSGRLACVFSNDLNVKRITEANFPLVEACFKGYGAALAKTKLVNITGEVAVMKHSITAFCDANSGEQLVLTWGGTCTGLAYRPFLIDGSAIKAGMPVVGFWEHGYRCNGGTFFTNVILNQFGPDFAAIRSNPAAMTFIRELTVPSASYSRTICRLVGWNDDGSPGEPLARIAGIAHITGGGVWGKFGELLPKGIGARLDTMPNPALVLLQGQRLSWDLEGLRLTDHQAYGTLHGGCGMLLVCSTDNDAQTVIEEARHDGITVQAVGRTNEHTAQGEKLVIRSRFHDYDRPLNASELKKS